MVTRVAVARKIDFSKKQARKGGQERRDLEAPIPLVPRLQKLLELCPSQGDYSPGSFFSGTRNSPNC